MYRRLSIPLMIIAAACSQGPPEYLKVAANDDAKIHIPLDQVEDGGVHFFTFENRGTRVNFLVRTDGNGTIHTHFDACFSCYRYKRGFVVEGSNLVCVACRYTYAIEDEVWDLIGACAPIAFRSSEDKDAIVIHESILEKGRRYFR